MDIWVVSTFWLLEIMLLRKFMCKFFGNVFFFLFRGTAQLFYKVAAPFYNPTSIIQRCQFLHILDNTFYCLFFLIRVS